MIRLSLSAVALLSLLSAAPSGTAGAQSAPTASTVDLNVNAQDRLAVKQVGLSRAAISDHTPRNDTAPVGATTTLVQSRTRRGQTLMIVGGAAFLAGLIIGDDAGNAIAIGGALIGLYGLYQWASTQ